MASTLKNVCLIDDDKIYQFTATMILEATGLTNSIAAFLNGKDAINFLKDPNTTLNSQLPDIIFLDINMPVMNGWEFLEEFQQFSASLSQPIKIYLVSSSVDESDINKSKNYPAVTDYVIKPLNRDKYRQLLTSQV
ncbi:MAG: response regulator [Sediminibacterium sp.]